MLSLWNHNQCYLAPARAGRNVEEARRNILKTNSYVYFIIISSAGGFKHTCFKLRNFSVSHSNSEYFLPEENEKDTWTFSPWCKLMMSHQFFKVPPFISLIHFRTQWTEQNPSQRLENLFPLGFCLLNMGCQEINTYPHMHTKESNLKNAYK